MANNKEDEVPRAASRIRMTKKIKQFICDKVSEGMTVAEICDRKFRGDLPRSNTVYKHEQKDPKFHEQLTRSYEIFFQRRLEELEYISTTDSKKLYPNMEDFRERAEARRIRVDALKFELGKLAPMLTNRFQASMKVEHSGDVGRPQIVIASYCKPEEKSINARLEEKSIDVKLEDKSK